MSCSKFGLPRNTRRAVHKGARLLPRCTSRARVRDRKRSRDSRRKVRHRTDFVAVLGIVATFASTSGKSIMGKIVLFLGLVTSAALFAVARIGAPVSESVAAREAQPARAVMSSNSLSMRAMASAVRSPATSALE